MRISDVLIRLIGAKDPNCPNEADVLAYSDGRLSTRRRAQVERHFADCHDCRQVLAFLARESDETPATLTEEAVSEQTNRVLAYVRNDERNKRVQNDQAASGFYISYPRLASVGLIICAIAAAGIYLIIRNPSPSDAAMVEVRLGLKDSRSTAARISGGFEHSRHQPGTVRGGDSDNETLHLDIAENLVAAAAQEPAAVEPRLVKARIHLARGTLQDARQALAILDQLAKNGVETPEVLNDTGVAHFIQGNYTEAITWFSKALTKSPAYYEALFNRALAEELTRRNDDDARRDWQTFIDKASGENWKNEARDHLNSLND